ncbi:MAG: hypothetical protein WBC99_05320, partial [Candidatus Omnitrophota bacterium]
MITIKKKNIIRALSIFLSITMFWQGIAWAAPDLFTRENLQVRTLITRDDAAASLLTAVPAYFLSYIQKLEREIENHNIFTIRRFLEKAINDIASSDFFKRSAQEVLPAVGGSLEEGDVVINLGNIVVRYYNPTVTGDQTPDPAYNVLSDENIGKYFSRQILMKRSDAGDDAGLAYDDEDVLDVLGLSYEEFLKLVNSFLTFEEDLFS